MSKLSVLAGIGALLSCAAPDSIASPGPSALAPVAPLPLPKDRAYPGELHVSVDARDIEHRVYHVHETLSGVDAATVLLYPKWLPGTHAPRGPIDRIAGLRISARAADQDTAVAWTRDTGDVFAIRLHAPGAVHSVEIDFDYLSPTSSKVGEIEASRDLLMVEWNELVLYPAGYFARRIPVTPSLLLPSGWQSATALTPVTPGTTGRIEFATTDLETLIDSPLYAGRHAAKFDLGNAGGVPVRLNVFADRAENLLAVPEALPAYRGLVEQAYRLFGSRHFAHYDFLYSLSDQIQQAGLEHHQSSENGSDPDSLSKWDATAWTRDLLPHEFTHSWNGKFRRPADLWTPNYNVPMQDSLLWVYEGQTQYWGQVLAARSGLWSTQQALDELAYTAAFYENQPGRSWRPLQDTTSDEIINPRRPQSWPDWQRFEDYYEEGKLIWLDVDTLIREQSHEQRSLDDFARSFFGIADGMVGPVTYTFDDVVHALNAVLPYDWAAFLRQRLDQAGRSAPLEGLRRGGYRLVYTDTPSAILSAEEEQRHHVDLLFSLGVLLEDSEKGEPASVALVRWDSPAFRAGLTEGAQILAINGIAYDEDVLRDAVRSSSNPDSAPIELVTRLGDRYRVIRVDYHEGLRYPHLERDAGSPARLDSILQPRR